MRKKDSKRVFLNALVVIFTASLFCPFSSRAAFTPEGLDSGFGDGGAAIFDLAPNDDWINAIALDAVSRTVAVGLIDNTEDNDVLVARFNIDGSLDTTFGTDGAVTWHGGYGYDEAHGVVIQPDGKIVVTGASDGETWQDALIMRLNSDGSFDTGFDTDGVQTWTGPNGISYLVGVALDASGNIVATGATRQSGGVYNDVLVMRLVSATGSLDTSFDGDGYATWNNVSGNRHDKGSDLAVQADGKIVVAGYTHNGSDYDSLVLRFDTDGSLDASFGCCGYAVWNGAGTSQNLYAVEIQPDGKIVAAGSTWDGVNYNDTLLIRYTSGGALDTTFDFDGYATWDDGSNEALYDCALDPSGNIVAVGYAEQSTVTYNDFLVLRYTGSGALDTSFSSDGYDILDSGCARDDEAKGVAIQNDGRIVVGGKFAIEDTQSDQDSALVRYSSTGTPDETYNGDGIVYRDFGTAGDGAHDVAIDADGKIVAMGEADNSDYYMDLFVMRSLSDGTLDNTFGTWGYVRDHINEYPSSGLAIQADGKIVVVESTNLHEPDFNLTNVLVERYGTTGALDPAFGDGGRVSWDTGAADSSDFSCEYGNKVQIDGDGKIVVAGSVDDDGTDGLLLRLNSSGSSDVDNFHYPDGYVTWNGGSGDGFFDLAVQPDGKIVVAGYTSNGEFDDALVLRFLADGSGLDSSFGTGGVVTWTAGYDDELYGVTVQPGDGSIVAAGYSDGGEFDNALMLRFLADGSLDPAFGAGGMLTWTGSYNDYFEDVAVRSDGTIVAGGYTQSESDFDALVVRYESDGTLDAYFGNSTPLGAYIWDSGFLDDKIYGVAIQPDGKIVAAGTADNGNNADTLLLRFEGTITQHDLSVVIDGTGAGWVEIDPPGALCTDPACSQTYADDTVVTVTATADAGSTFAGWSGDCSGVAATCTITMTAALTATATFDYVPVTHTVENADDSGAGSLQQAVTDACSGDTIAFNPGLAGSVILVTPTYYIDKDVTIKGLGQDALTLSGMGATRVVKVESGASVTIKDITIADGMASWGGGIYNTGTLTLTNCTVRDSASAPGGPGGGIKNSGTLIMSGCTVAGNQAGDGDPVLPGGGGSGGGIYNEGTAVITESKIANNRAGHGADDSETGGNGGHGGGIFNGLTAQITLTYSSVGGNMAGNGGVAPSSGNGGHGGGLYSQGDVRLANSTIRENESGFGGTDGAGGGIFSGGNLLVSNSTISGNVAHGHGGGLHSTGGTVLLNATIVDNEADSSGLGPGDGGGMFRIGGTIFVKNSIIAQNRDLLSDGATEYPDCAGTYTSSGYNLVGDDSGCGGFTNGVGGDKVGSYPTPLDPKIGFLADNGGPTWTHALLYDSPAVDAGAPSGFPSYDQRGLPRPRDGDNDGTFTCDMGAYELTALCIIDVTPTSASFSPVFSTGTLTVTASHSSCTWQAGAINDPWIGVVTGTDSTGTDVVIYEVQENFGPARSGTVFVKNEDGVIKSATVNQASGCAQNLYPANASYTAAGGTGSIAVQGPPQCSWTAVSGAGWVTITAGAGGSGGGQVDYSVAAKATPGVRSTQITIGSESFTVTQAGTTGSGAPAANFSGFPVSGDLPLPVSFTDLSTGNVTGWAWNFGDGTTSTLQNPEHVYSRSGTYTVRLGVSGPGGSDVETKAGYVTVTVPPPEAGFMRWPPTGPAPLGVKFINTSRYANRYMWDFGDNTTSTAKNPGHFYTTPGSYTVKMAAKGPGGYDMVVKGNIISVTTPPLVANFYADPVEGNGPLDVRFTDNSSGTITSRLWHFGDGTTSTDQDPDHTYAASGSYPVSLTITGTGGTARHVKPNYIVVKDDAPVAGFSASATGITAGETVDFTNQSTGTVTSRLWNFGDGGNSTGQNPSHTYHASGTYTVGLIVRGPGGVSAEVKNDYISVTPGAASHSLSGTLTGEITKTVQVRLSGDIETSTVTGNDGTYEFQGLADGGDYTVAPLMRGISFEPVTRTYSAVSADITGADFVSEAQGPSIPSAAVYPAAVFANGLSETTLLAYVYHPYGDQYIESVTADLSPIGGVTRTSLLDDGDITTSGDEIAGDGLYTVTATVDAETPPGKKLLVITAEDRDGKTYSESVELLVEGALVDSGDSEFFIDNDIAGQTLIITYYLLGPEAAGCTVYLDVYRPDGTPYFDGPVEFAETVNEIEIRDAEEGQWRCVITRQCAGGRINGGTLSRLSTRAIPTSYSIQTSTSGTGVVVGIVVGSDTGQGLDGATITTNLGGSTRADSDGYYSLLHPAGMLIVKGQATNYYSGQVSLQLSSGGSVFENMTLSKIPTPTPTPAPSSSGSGGSGGTKNTTTTTVAPDTTTTTAPHTTTTVSPDTTTTAPGQATTTVPETTTTTAEIVPETTTSSSTTTTAPVCELTGIDPETLLCGWLFPHPVLLTVEAAVPFTWEDIWAIDMGEAILPIISLPVNTKMNVLGVLWPNTPGEYEVKIGECEGRQIVVEQDWLP